MINEEYKAMLGGKSVIRELSEYATSRGAEIGYQNVFDYSLGNPSVPAPKSFTDAMVDLYENGDPVAIHGYSPSLGIPSVKDAIAENLNERFGMAYTGTHIFPTHLRPLLPRIPAVRQGRRRQADHRAGRHRELPNQLRRIRGCT